MQVIIDGIDFFNLQAEKYWSPTKNMNLSALVQDAIQSEKYLGSRKVDGHWYMMIKAMDGEIYFRGRTASVNGGYHNKIDWVPHLKDVFKNFPNGTVLIGETYFRNKEGSRNVTTIMGCLPEKAIARQEKGEKLAFYAFDVLAYEGRSIMDEAFEKRVSLLTNEIKSNFFRCFLSEKKDTYVDFAKFYQGEQLLNYIAWLRAKGYEGAVLQRKDGKYEPGKRPARKSIKVKKELDNEIDCFLTGNYKSSTFEYTGKEIDTWTYWFNDKTNEYLEGKHYLEFLDGAPLTPITKGAFYHWAGAVEIGVIKNEEIIPIGWISNVTEDIKQQITLPNSPLIHKVCKVSAMMIEHDTHALRHAKITEWRDDISWKDCTYEKAFS